MTLNALIAATAALQRLDGVAGILLCKAENIVHRQMPFSNERAAALQVIANQMLDGYRQVKRAIRQIYLEFDGGHLLFMAQDESLLVVVLTGRADPDLVSSVGGALLWDHSALLATLPSVASAVAAAETVEELVVTSPRRVQEMTKTAVQVTANWPLLRQQMEAVLNRVMGSAQAARLIDRTLEASQIGDPYRLQVAQARELAQAVLEQVPNTGKRRQLMAELDRHLVTMNL